MNKHLESSSIDWGICGSNTFANALYNAIRYTSKSTISVAAFMVLSGQAFRRSTNKEVVPMDAYDVWGMTEAALENLGFGTKLAEGGYFTKEWSPDQTESALELIRDSIGRGIPVIGYNLDNYEFGLICGYDDANRTLSISDVSSSNGTISYDELGQRPRFGEPIPPELFVMSLVDLENKVPHVHYNRNPEQDHSYRFTLRRSLDIILEHVHNKRIDHRNCSYGLAAIDAWISGFDEGTAHSFFTSYNLMNITSALKFVPKFFIESSHPEFFSVQDYRLQQFMADTAVCYAEAYRDWVLLSQLFPFPKSADTTDPDKSHEAIRLLKNARKAESAGAELLLTMRSLLDS